MALLLYYSGIVWLYGVIRKSILSQYRLTILMYHRVRDDSVDPDMSVSTTHFDRQMGLLSKSFDVISLAEVVELLNGDRSLRRDTVAITFDDGYQDNYVNAFPILNKHGLTATVFIISGRVGEEGMLSLTEIKEMRRAGWEIGSHTITHPILKDLSDEAAKREIVDSKRDLEALLGEEINVFAYPKGKKLVHLDDRDVSLVREAGYRAAVVTDNGWIDRGSDPCQLRRIGIRNVPMFVVKARLSGIFESYPFRKLRAVAGLH